MSRSERTLAGVMLAVALLLLVPWQGNYDRLGDLARIPVPSASSSPAAVTDVILKGGAAWRVEPDYSFFLVTHLAIAQRASWPLVSPMGPLAFLFRGWHPGTAVLLLLGWMAIVAMFFVGAWSLARGSGLKPPEAAAWFCALIFAVFALPRDTILLLSPILLLGAHFVPDARRVRDVTAVLVAISALVKTSSLVGAAVVIGVITIDEARRRTWPRCLGVFSLAFVALYLLAGRSLRHLISWLGNSAEILRHFGEAWSLAASYPLQAMLLAVTVMVLSATRWRESRLHAIAFMLIGATFIKAGFVRADEFHLLISRTAILSLLVVGALPLRRPLLAAATAVAVVATLPAVSVGEVQRQLVAAVHPVAAHRASVALFETEMAGIRKITPLPPLQGTVDWYDARQSVVIANGLAYDPRPVFQGLNVVSPVLEQVNAKHISGGGAPHWIFYEPLPTDDRLPAGEDALSWPARLAAYDVRAVAGTLALLSRRATPRTWQLQPLGVADVEIGKSLELPVDQPLWVQIDVRPTILGNLKSATLGLPPLFMEIVTPQRTGRCRLIPSVARGGFLLSPVVTSATAYAALAENRLDVLRPMEARNIRVVGDTQVYSSHVTVRLYRLLIDYAQ